MSLIAALASCSSGDYVDAVPQDCKALLAVAASKTGTAGNLSLLKNLLHVTDLEKTGIDFKEKVYLFEAPDGNLGLCARVGDADDLRSLFKDLSDKGVCTNLPERRGFRFVVINDNWVAGYSDNALLVMGPAVPEAQAELRNRMSKLLAQDEEHGVKATPMFDKLDSIRSPMAFVAQAQALPDNFMLPFTIGAPADADPSQVLLAVGATLKEIGGKQVLYMEGETFSFSKRINIALTEARKSYRPIKGVYRQRLYEGDPLGIFMNVDGRTYIRLLQANPGMQGLLAGVNTTIDMDNIIRSINGDMFIAVRGGSEDKPLIDMVAELGDVKVAQDVDYWKSSCPAGTKITGQRGSYRLTGPDLNFDFGFTPDEEFYLESSPFRPSNRGNTPHALQLPPALQAVIAGKHLCMIAGMDGILGAHKEAAKILKPVIGDVDMIVFCMK